MNIIRSIFAVILGYLIFAVSAGALFQLSGQPPHQPAPLPFMIGSIVFGMAFAFIGGYTAAWLAGRKPLPHGVFVAIILALGASVSLAATYGKGAIWSQPAALLLMAPSAALGGWMRSRRARQA